MPTVDFYFEKKKVEVGKGANLRGVARANNIQIYEGPFALPLPPPLGGNCHGLGLCGTCVVEILEGMENLTPRTRMEKWHLKKLPPTFRLSCRCKVLGDVTVITKPKPE